MRQASFLQREAETFHKELYPEKRIYYSETPHVSRHQSHFHFPF